jgi:hypothetical protein
MQPPSTITRSPSECCVLCFQLLALPLQLLPQLLRLALQLLSCSLRLPCVPGLLRRLAKQLPLLTLQYCELCLQAGKLLAVLRCS